MRRSRLVRSRLGRTCERRRSSFRHMTSVLGYARTFFEGGQYRPEPLPGLFAEIARFHAMLETWRTTGATGAREP